MDGKGVLVGAQAVLHDAQEKKSFCSSSVCASSVTPMQSKPSTRTSLSPGFTRPSFAPGSCQRPRQPMPFPSGTRRLKQALQKTTRNKFMGA